MKRMGFLAIAAWVIGFGSVASAVAAAPGAYERVAVTVAYEDLNILNEAGAKILYQRLKSATKEACALESYVQDRSLARLSDARACYEKTLTQAVNQIDSAALKAIHAG